MLRSVWTGVRVLAVLLLFVMVSGLQAGVLVDEVAPDFSLPDTEGKTHALSDYRGQFVVLEWVNHGCPFVRKFYGAGEMQRLQQVYRDQGVVWLSICSSHKGGQGYYEAADATRVTKEKGALPTAYLLDPDCQVARQYGARNTPHMYVIDPNGVLLYQGAIDSIRSAKVADIERAENYVVSALDAALAGEPVATKVTRPYGCAVKYD